MEFGFKNARSTLAETCVSTSLIFEKLKQYLTQSRFKYSMQKITKGQQYLRS